MQANVSESSLTSVAAASSANITRWAGRILSGVPALFLVFDGVIKLLNVQPVVEASQLLGLPVGLAPGVGVLLLACLAVYLLPRTTVLGAILLTGYLGGAISLQLRVGAPAFSLLFPAILAVMLWGGLYLRNPQLRTLIPLRR